MIATNTNEKAPGAYYTRGLETDTNDLNFATGTRRRKAESNLQAILALAGYSVHPLRDGGYLVCKYGYAQYASDLEDLQAFAMRLEVCK